MASDLEGLRQDEEAEVDEDYCDDCDNEHWLPNDEREAVEDDPIWKPCPWCNNDTRYPLPYVFEVIRD